MSDSLYYKIDDPETLTKIHAFFAKRDEFYSRVKELCEKYGFKYHRTTDSIIFGIKFHSLGFDPKDQVINESLWKVSKNKNSHILNVQPRATAKAHKEEYLKLIPEKLEYKELNKIILADGVDIGLRSYGYRYRKDGIFMFETSLKVASTAIEILGSEYRKEIDED